MTQTGGDGAPAERPWQADAVTDESTADAVDDGSSALTAPGPAAPGRIGAVRVAVLVAIGLVVVAVAYYLVSLVQVWSTGRDHDAGPTDAIVVLGAAQYDGRPSPQLEARLDHVVTLYEDGVAPLVAVTGGQQPGDRFTEAGTARRYLIDAGVPAEVIVGEDQGRSTHESLAGLVDVLREATGEERPLIALVTDPYHAERAALTAGEVGFDVDVAATPDSVVRGWNSFRRHLREAGGVAVGRFIGFDEL